MRTSSAFRFVAIAAWAIVSGCTTGNPFGTTSPDGTPTTPAATASPGRSTAPATSAPSTSGGGLAYVLDHNIWLAGPDGTGARQLTADGTSANAYHDPSQADDGTIFALRGSSTLVRLDRAGNVLSQGNVNALENGAEGLAASPDGSRVAYATTGYGTTTDPRFGTPTGTFLYGGTDVATADGASVPSAAMGLQLFPAWLDDSRVVTSDGVGLYSAEVGQEPVAWLLQDDGCVIELDCPSGAVVQATLSKPSVNRDGALLAYTYKPYFGPAGRRVASIVSSPPTPPETRCVLPGQQDYSDPGTFAPDGSQFAYDDARFDPELFEAIPGQGVYVIDVDLEAEDCGASTARMILPGASQPDWGPTLP